MPPVAPKLKLTYAQYAEREATSEHKHEFFETTSRFSRGAQRGSADSTARRNHEIEALPASLTVPDPASRP
jgi:hypothetical protein